MAALEEHEDFMGEFLSKKGNTIEDLADVLQATYPEQRGFSSIEVSSAFVKKKGLNVEELFQMNNLMMLLELQSLRYL
jgi:hypothetical protein